MKILENFTDEYFSVLAKVWLRLGTEIRERGLTPGGFLRVSALLPLIPSGKSSRSNIVQYVQYR